MLLRTTAARAMGALALVSLSSALSAPRPARAEPTVEKRYAAAFLNSEGIATLHGTVKPIHNDVVKQPHLTVAYTPQGASLAKIAMQIGRPVDLKVKAIVTDEHAQTVIVELVKATDDDDGGVPFLVENAVPHVTVSVDSVHDGYGHFYGNHLISRAVAAAGGFDNDWTGILPARDGYDQTICKIEVPKERTILTATLCTDDLWDNEAHRCGPEKQCGFCRFMKLGPCGKEFAAWEDCIDKCKETEADFVDKCARQTLALKACVDKNPEYYYSVIDDEEENAAEATEVTQVTPESDNVAKSPEKSNSTLIEVDTNAKVEVNMSATVDDDEDNYTTHG